MSTLGPSKGGDARAAAAHLRTQIEAAIAYTRMRREAPRRWAMLLRLATVGLAAASTVILGFQDVSGWTAAAFTFTALVTLLGAIEPFFNHRAIWVLLEDAQAKHHRVLDDLDFHLAERGTNEPDLKQIEALHRRYQEIWQEMEEHGSTSGVVLLRDRRFRGRIPLEGTPGRRIPRMRFPLQIGLFTDRFARP